METEYFRNVGECFTIDTVSYFRRHFNTLFPLHSSDTYSSSANCTFGRSWNILTTYRTAVFPGVHFTSLHFSCPNFHRPISLFPPVSATNQFHACIFSFLFIFFSHRSKPTWGYISITWCFPSHIHLDTPQSVGFLWTSDQPVVETSIWQHTTFTRKRHKCSRRDLTPQTPQTMNHKPSPYTARSPGLVIPIQ